jgi:hypothetical protein
MIKIQQKISGCWRTTNGAERFLALRSYISTTRKQRRDTIDALAHLALHQPWLPDTADPNPRARPEQSRRCRAFASRRHHRTPGLAAYYARLGLFPATNSQSPGPEPNPSGLAAGFAAD